MTLSESPDQPTLLSRELRWLVSLRWLAGLAIAGSVAASLLWTDWSARHAQILGLCIAVLAYNAAFHVLLRSRIDERGDTRRGLVMAWAQMLLDLMCLSLLAVWTGGIGSPLLVLFIPHMVMASLLLPGGHAYLAAGAAGLFLFTSAWWTGQWPLETGERLIWAPWMATLLLTCLVTNHITNGLRRRDRDLDRQAHRLTAILDNTVEAIITIDERGIIQAANRAVEKIFEYDADELIGRNINVIMPEPDRSRHDDYIANYVDTGVARIIGIGREVTGQRRDGTMVCLDLSVTEVETGNDRLFTGIVRDISNRKKRDAELQSLNETLRRQQEAIVQHEKMVALGRMAAGVAHEISNPLASLDALLQLLERKPERFTASSVKTLREQVSRIDRIVREMTSFSHPNETGWETRGISDVVEASLEMLRFDHRIRAVRIDSEFFPGPDEVRMMPQGIQQVIVNLMLNALDAVAEAADPRIVISTRREDDMFVIEVADNGVGIEPAHLDRVLDPFFTTKAVGHGTGLGLSISYSIVERHGGRLEVSSTPAGQGAVFSVYLPGLPKSGMA